MPKIVGYYDRPASGVGGIADLLGLSPAAMQDAGRQAAEGALPVLEEKINEKMLIAGVAAAAGFAGLAALIWFTRAR